MRMFKVAAMAGMLAAAVFVGTRLGGKPVLARAAAGCDATSLNSSFGFGQTGYAYDAVGNLYVLAGNGLISADGNGNLTGSDTLSYDGTVFRRKLTGTYKLNADCSGNVTLTFSDKSVMNGDIVVVNDGKQVNYNGTDTDFIYSGTWSRISQAVPAQ